MVFLGTQIELVSSVEPSEVLGAGRVWSNPDCGLKTRGWAETETSLRHLVNATAAVRSELEARTPEPAHL